METISAEVGVEVGDTLLMACNKSMQFKIIKQDADGFDVEDEMRSVYRIPHDHLRLYLVVIK